MKRFRMIAVLLLCLMIPAALIACGGRYRSESRRSGCSTCSLGCAACTLGCAACTACSLADGCLQDSGY